MIYLCLSFDVPNSYEKSPKSLQEVSDGLKYCIDFLKEIDCINATWFIDEYGYKITQRLPEDLLELSEYGEIGLHSHLNYPPYGDRGHIPQDYSIIYSKIKRAKESLEKFLIKNERQQEVTSVRSGGFLTNNFYFKAIYDANLKVDSSITAFHSIKTMSMPQIVSRYVLRRMGITFHDINSLPAGAQPYYFDWGKFLRLSKGGEMIEAPVNIFTRMQERGFKIGKLFSEQLGKNKGFNNIFITLCMHPFEFLKNNSELNKKYFNSLLDFFSSVSEKYDYKFIKITDIGRLME